MNPPNPSAFFSSFTYVASTSVESTSKCKIKYCCPVKVFQDRKIRLNPLVGFQPLLLLCCCKKTSNMSKSTYFTGQPVYSQVIKLLDKAKIQQISHETLVSERYVKRLTGWKHLIIMLFGILKHFDSLRELEIGMKAETMKLSH